MSALIHIALAEFGKAFARRVGTPAARDFLWLTVFFSLSAFLVFVGWSARDGVWARFEQVLLGALPESGPPIRLSRHLDLVGKIRADIIAKFERDFPGLGLFPIRQLDGQIGAITLPGLTYEPPQDGREPQEADLSWGPARDGARTDFLAYAMPLDSPLWSWIKARNQTDVPGADAQAPLVVAANRTLFRKHFRFGNYRRAVTGNHGLPCPVRSALPERLGPDEDLDSVVLEVKEAAGRSGYQQFKILWVDSLPLPEQVAMVLPLSTMEIAEAASENRRGLEVRQEHGGASVRRVTSLRLRDIDADAAGVDDFRRIADCMGAIPSEADRAMTVCGARWEPVEAGQRQERKIPRLAESSFDLTLSASREWAMRAESLEACARGTRFAGFSVPAASGGPLFPALAVDLTEPSAAVAWAGYARVRVPCDVLADAAQAADGERPPNACAAGGADARGTITLTGYDDTMVYVGHRRRSRPEAAGPASEASGGAMGERPGAAGRGANDSLDEIVQRLLAWKTDEGRTVFRLDPAYERALVRFGVLSTIVDRLALPLAGGMLVLYLVFSGVILATTFLHRRPQYGLLFMNGVQPWKIEIIVLIQIGLACLIGCVLGYLCFSIVAELLNTMLASNQVIRKAALLIGLDIPVFLGQLPPFQIVLIWFFMTMAGFSTGALLLRLQGISSAKAPIDLLKS